MWSCGVILFIMFSGQPPFNAANDLEVLQKIKIGKYSMDAPCWEHVSADAKDLLTRLLEYDPDKRYSAIEALKHQWFREKPKSSSVLLEKIG